MILDGSQREALQKALLSAFPKRGALERMVDFGLSKNLAAIAGTGTLEEVVFELITWANSYGRVEDLLRAAQKANQTNPDLAAFIETLKRPNDQVQPPATVATDALQPEVTPTSRPNIAAPDEASEDTIRSDDDPVDPKPERPSHPPDKDNGDTPLERPPLPVAAFINILLVVVLSFFMLFLYGEDLQITDRIPPLEFAFGFVLLVFLLFHVLIHYIRPLIGNVPGEVSIKGIKLSGGVLLGLLDVIHPRTITNSMLWLSVIIVMGIVVVGWAFENGPIRGEAVVPTPTYTPTPDLPPLTDTPTLTHTPKPTNTPTPTDTPTLTPANTFTPEPPPNCPISEVSYIVEGENGRQRLRSNELDVNRGDSMDLIIQVRTNSGCYVEISRWPTDNDARGVLVPIIGDAIAIGGIVELKAGYTAPINPTSFDMGFLLEVSGAGTRTDSSPIVLSVTVR